MKIDWVDAPAGKIVRLRGLSRTFFGSLWLSFVSLRRRRCSFRKRRCTVGSLAAVEGKLELSGSIVELSDRI